MDCQNLDDSNDLISTQLDCPLVNSLHAGAKRRAPAQVVKQRVSRAAPDSLDFQNAAGIRGGAARSLLRNLRQCAPLCPGVEATRRAQGLTFIRRFAETLCATLALSAVGCSSPPGEIFPPITPAIVFPSPPDQARIRYVGKIETETDLRPGVSFAKEFSDKLFGVHPAQSLKLPMAVCVNQAGRLLVADMGARVVHVFDLKTRAYWQLTPGPEQLFNEPVGVTCDPAGRIFVADSSAGVIYVFDPAGKRQPDFGRKLLGRPCGLAYDARSARLFVADAGRHNVAVFSSSGKLLTVIGGRGAQLGQFNFPTNVALDSKGRLYVSDSLNFRVQQFDANLHPLRQIGGKGDVPGFFGQPKGIALDSQDHLYVVDANYEVVQIFDDGGNLLMDFGGEGSAPGQFWLPAGIFIDASNRIWIADSYNHRVQALDFLAEK